MKKRKLASVQKLLELKPIEGADLIEEAKIMGWHVAVKKGDFKVGDKVVYCEIDSILPKENPNFAFLDGKPIKTKRLRGIYSQGIAFPVSILPDGDWNFGDDVTELLKVTKWEPDEYNRQGTGGKPFPSWIPKSDETRVAVLQEWLDRYKGIPCVYTEKLDGSSLTAFLDEDKSLHVCSRNLEITDPANFMYQTAMKLGFKEKLEKLGAGAVVQGEIVGSGIQANRYGFKDKRIFIYNLRLDNKYAENEIEAKMILENAGFETVPMLNRDYKLSNDIDKLTEMSIGKSILNSKVEREGIVIRPLERTDVNCTDDYFADGRLSFKVINPKYLVKYNL